MDASSRVVPLFFVLACSGSDSPPLPGDTDEGGGTFESGDSSTSNAGTSGPSPGDAGGGDASSCSPQAQDCGEGLRCVPYSADGDATWNGARCTPVSAEPKGLGETCTAPTGPVGGVDDCDVGLMCWNVATDGVEGTCFALCAGDGVGGGACAGAQTVCSVYNDGVLPICLSTCDPLGQDCGEGQICIPQGSGDKFVCAVDASPTSGSYGDPCLAFNKCDAGLFCAASQSVPGCTQTLGCCSDFCDLSSPDPDGMCSGTSQGQSCVPWSSQPAPGFESLGACTVVQ